jgi:hypothetical protein
MIQQHIAALPKPTGCRVDHILIGPTGLMEDRVPSVDLVNLRQPLRIIERLRGAASEADQEFAAGAKRHAIRGQRAQQPVIGNLL